MIPASINCFESWGNHQPCPNTRLDTMSTWAFLPQAFSGNKLPIIDTFLHQTLQAQMFIQALKQIEHQLGHNLWDLQSFKRGNSIFCTPCKTIVEQNQFCACTQVQKFCLLVVGRGECVWSLFVFSEFFPLKKDWVKKVLNLNQ